MRQLLTALLTIGLAFLILGMAAAACLASVETELISAVRHNNIQRVRTLLSEGVRVNETDQGAERTPLMWAVEGRNTEIAITLLQHGAAVNARDDFGETALSLAEKNHDARMAVLLLKHGAKGALKSGPSDDLHLRTAVHAFQLNRIHRRAVRLSKLH